MRSLLLLMSASILPVVAGVQAQGYKPAEMKFSVVEQGINSGVKDQDYTVIRTQVGLENFLKKHKEVGAKAYQGTEWKTTQYLAIYGGQAPTGGYGVAVKRVLSLGPAESVVEALLTRPAPGTITTQALTTPYTVIRMPKQLGKLTVKWVTE